jgi:hypothetical protein
MKPEEVAQALAERLVVPRILIATGIVTPAELEEHRADAVDYFTRVIRNVGDDHIEATIAQAVADYLEEGPKT